jgi:membrane-bound lytic murein transglycosylase F
MTEQIRKKGELVVISRNGPTTYYQGGEGYLGLEYELVSRFAKYLGVKLKLLVPDNLEDILPMIIRREAHLAAAGLTITKDRSKIVRFGPPYQEITQHLVYRSGSKRPKSLEDILDGQLEVTAGSSHAERLQELAKIHPDLQWKENRNLSSNELLNLVYEQVIDYTIADSNDLTLFQRYHKEVHSAFPISEPQALAWAMPYNTDDSLQEEANNFFRKLSQSGELEQLIERYYGHADQLGFVGTRLYLRHVKTRLADFQDTFEQAADKYNLDWRLLAAIGYQESHWRPEAKSPTGVRGIMMLTQVTARQLDIGNRLDPEQSIEGGAKYLRRMLNRLPDDIEEPDKTWLALAAYNVGFYHLKDARMITEELGKDPNKWIDVKESLPLLSQKKWYEKTLYGYARGNEPVDYVENIRIYYDLLTWHDDKENARRNTPKLLFPDVDSSAF